MFPAALNVASLASLWVALQGTLGVSATSRGGARSGVGEMGKSLVGYDVDGGLGVSLSVSEAPFSLGLGYSPSMTVRDVKRSDRSYLVMHGGFLNLGYGGRGYSLSLSQGFSVGTTSFRGLRTNPVNPMAMPSPTMSRVDLVPGTDTAKVFNSSTTASFSYQWDPRWSSGLGAGYSISGGSGGAAQAAYPQLRSASASASTGYAMSTWDTFGLQAGLGRITTRGGTTVTAPMGPLVMSPDFRYWTLNSALNWAHKFSTTTGGSLSLGAYGYSSTSPGRTTRYTLAFTGGGSFDAELMRLPGFTLSGGVGAGVSPAVNQLNGSMQQRVQGTGRVGAAMGKLSVTANGDAGQSFPANDPNAVRLLGAGLNVSYSPATLVNLFADYHSTWQTAGGGGMGRSIPRLWVVSVGVSVSAPPLRLF